MSERRTVTSAPRSEEHTSELQSQSNLVCRIIRSEEHTSELQSQSNLVCRLLLEKKNQIGFPVAASSDSTTSLSPTRWNKISRPCATTGLLKPCPTSFFQTTGGPDGPHFDARSLPE